MKKLLYFIDDLNYMGGAHIATYNQIEYLLSTRKYQISIASASSPSELLKKKFPEIQFFHVKDFESKNEIQLLFLKFQQIFSNPTFTIKKRLKKFITSIYSKLYDHNKTSSNLISTAKCKQEVLSLIGMYDIVCVPFENSCFRDLIAESKCNRKIQWIHIDYITWKNTNAATKLISKDDYIRYQQFNQIVFVSFAARRGFLSLFPDLQNKCAVCYNLMDINRIKMLANQPIPKLDSKKGGKINRLVTVARLEDIQKGIKRTLNVAKRLLDEGFAFEWLIIGDGPDEKMLKRYASDLKLESCVFWIGHTDNPFAYIKQADLFALFSYYEGIPNTIFESLIIGTPVIATGISGIKEQLEGGWGYIVENDTESIYLGLSDLLRNPQKIAQIRQKLKDYQYDNESIQKELDIIMHYQNGYYNGVVEENMKVSIIVPVYNVEKYLEKCLDSLIAQTIDEMEIIVVNDGSTDSSQKIIDYYQKLYPNKVRGFSKKNGGLGDARNYGLQYAKGRYVSFIDSDDWVTPEMMQHMYQKGVENNASIVLCDIYGVDDQTNHTIVERAPFDKEGILDRKQAVLLSTRPVAVSACTKLFKQDIFKRFQFPLGWYEDLAIMTTIFSYIERIYYLREPHYYYRWNRVGSIQSQKSSPKTLEILNSQQRVLNTCNPEFALEANYAIYDHSARMYASFPVYRAQILTFIEQNICCFEGNPHVEWAIENGIHPRLFSKEKIPKKIHYCWFGKGEKGKVVLDCIESWKKILSDYEIVEWNESNCDIQETPYVAEAYQQKKWAYVSDYFRFKALYEYGGIYLDTDVMVYSTLDSMLFYDAFFAFETYMYVHGGIIGAKPKRPIIQSILEGYRKEQYFNVEKHLTVCHRITESLLSYGLYQNGKLQIIKHNIAIFPANILTVDFSDGECIAEHLYNASWLHNKRDNKSFKYEVMKHYFTYPLMHANQSNIVDVHAAVLPPYQMVDKTIDTYGIKIVMRQLLKAVIQRILPTRIYQVLTRYIHR
ncbi:glycosyl transferase-like sugar-binding protein [Hydrogenoanaerobacterium saccharovorans]|uniref:Glycosyltransferase sugar-binding region containing DXD motif-containing protein n=1 Tax=Hydrogenoanaerobacterium saccharovorans TaxID=474960 RepID=A0A1H8EG21_9FIRM|nr:glycosyltransferase [Hydrogenoanaerobacterium saccharovorans]RPF42142.1 glycosyl transferase-like sugar-binding protein [Hydrogenoanaerobacterium saccharovorans]SEN18074.1 Glycosyltransferase sugar-binding region containing DXD motif-containing protein [Hydrogenoanaerobacterium saccharovorans]